VNQKKLNNNYEYFELDESLSIKMKKTSHNGAFHFHSYILAYAGIAMISQFLQLQKSNANILAINVDSITIALPDRGINNQIQLPNDKNIGGWKHEINPALKDHYVRLKDVTKPTNDYQCEYTEPRSGGIYSAPEFTRTLPINDRLIIIGPGGIGKTYPFVDTPYAGQMITRLTIEGPKLNVARTLLFLRDLRSYKPSSPTTDSPSSAAKPL